MDTHAKAVNEWASLLGCASRLERNLKLSQKLVNEKSLEALESAYADYLDRYRRIVEAKKVK